MNFPIKIALFLCPSTQGFDLAQNIKAMLDAQTHINGRHFEMRVVTSGKQFDFMQACLGDDVVIFDGSVEDNKGANYEAATAQPSVVDHVLVVSRTALPLNFTALRSLAPEPGHPGKKNDELVAWIKSQLEDLCAAGRLPRPAEQRLWIPSLDQVSSLNDKMQAISNRIYEQSLETAERLQRLANDTFISFLSQYSTQHASRMTINSWNVEKLVEKIGELHGGAKVNVHFYPPGALSSEFLTEQRRWQVVSFIDRKIRLMKEFWIFESDDYYNSWWTQAELASLMYLKSDQDKPLPKIIVFNPHTGEQREESSEFIPVLTERQHQEMARYFSNSDSATSGIESAQAMMMLRKMPKFLQRINFWVTMRMQKRVLSPSSPLAETLKDLTFERYQESVNSHVYEESFWTDRIVTCPKCRELNVNKQRFDFDRFLKLEGNGYYRISEGEMCKLFNQGFWICPKEKCGTRYEIIRQPYDQFIWWPVRGGNATGPNGVFIEKQATYSLTQKPKAD